MKLEERTKLKEISQDISDAGALLASLHSRLLDVDVPIGEVDEEVYQYMREAQEGLMLAREYISRSIFKHAREQEAK